MKKCMGPPIFFNFLVYLIPVWFSAIFTLTDFLGTGVKLADPGWLQDVKRRKLYFICSVD
jgi:hypothetical protein